MGQSHLRIIIRGRYVSRIKQKSAALAAVARCGVHDFGRRRLCRPWYQDVAGALTMHLVKSCQLLRTFTCLIVALPLLAANLQVLAQSGSNVSPDQEESLKKALRSWDTSNLATSDKYIAAFRDLNGDGKQEAIVYLIGSGWCGSGGCNTLILARTGTSWKVISTMTVTRPPIRVLSETSHGWHSLGALVAGGGITRAYEAVLRFNGKSYPRNPTVSPAFPVKAPEGDIVIPSSSNASALYP